jgi:predicted MFS family arabinose efflux permease
MGVMAAGMALTLWDFLPAVLAGLLLFTAGFFAAHSIGAGWSGTLPADGKAQSASLYNLFYYLGSSVLGWLGGLVFQSAGWAALAWGVIALSCATAAVTAVAHPSAKPARAVVVTVS